MVKPEQLPRDFCESVIVDLTFYWPWLTKSLIPVRNTRDWKKDMILNDSLPKMEVDPETYTVKADEELHLNQQK